MVSENVTVAGKALIGLAGQAVKRAFLAFFLPFFFFFFRFASVLASLSESEDWAAAAAPVLTAGAARPSPCDSLHLSPNLQLPFA